MTILAAVPVRQFLYDDLAELVLPSSILLRANTDEVELPSDPRFRIAQIMEGFVKRFAQVLPIASQKSPSELANCLQPFVDTVRSACLNRCRVRRTICHTAVDWDNLQMEVCFSLLYPSAIL